MAEGWQCPFNTAWWGVWGLGKRSTEVIADLKQVGDCAEGPLLLLCLLCLLTFPPLHLHSMLFCLPEPVERFFYAVCRALKILSLVDYISNFWDDINPKAHDWTYIMVQYLLISDLHGQTPFLTWHLTLEDCSSLPGVITESKIGKLISPWKLHSG